MVLGDDALDGATGRGHRRAGGGVVVDLRVVVERDRRGRRGGVVVHSRAVVQDHRAVGPGVVVHVTAAAH